MLIASTSLLLATGIAASTGSPSYTGEITFGAPTVTRTCAHGTPREVTVSVPFDATRLTGPIMRRFAARFSYQGRTFGYLRAAAPITVTIRPGERSPLSEHFSVPADRTYNHLDIGLLDGGTAESWASVALSCGSVPVALPAPTVSSVNHPCLAATTARVANASSRAWTLDPIVGGSRSATTTVGAHSSATVTIGYALRGAERFMLSSTASTATSSMTVALIDFDAPCVRGYPRTSFSATRLGSLVRLSAVERPILPTGTTVDFYQLVDGRRHLVGAASTGSTGIATTTVTPYRSHTTFLAVISPTHYSYATTTPTAIVP